MKKIAFVFVAAIATSFAASMTSCSEGNKAGDSCSADSVATELTDACCADSCANDSCANDSCANDSVEAPEA